MSETDKRTHMLFLPKTKLEILDKSAGPFLYSPDSYPVESFVPPHLQRTRESEFMLLHEGVEYVFSAPRHAATRERMHDILNRAFNEFLGDDTKYARQLIEEFMDLVRAT